VASIPFFGTYYNIITSIVLLLLLRGLSLEARP
jgi:hypothetical protein